MMEMVWLSASSQTRSIIPLEIESTRISSPAVRGRGGNAAEFLINRLEYPTTDYNRQVKRMSAVLSASPLFALIQIVYLTSFDLDRFDQWVLQSAENRIILWKQIHITMYRVSRSDSSLSVDWWVPYGLRSVKEKIASAWSNRSWWARQPRRHHQPLAC